MHPGYILNMGGEMSNTSPETSLNLLGSPVYQQNSAENAQGKSILNMSLEKMVKENKLHAIGSGPPI